MGIPGLSFLRYMRSFGFYKQNYNESKTFEEVQGYCQIYGPHFVPSYRPEFRDYVLKCTECGIEGGNNMNRCHGSKCSHFVQTSQSDLYMTITGSEYLIFRELRSDNVRKINFDNIKNMEGQKIIYGCFPLRGKIYMGKKKYKSEQIINTDTDDDMDEKAESDNPKKRHSRATDRSEKRKRPTTSEPDTTFKSIQRKQDRLDIEFDNVGVDQDDIVPGSKVKRYLTSTVENPNSAKRVAL